MAIEDVRNYLKPFNKDAHILEFAASTATVDEAAAAVGVQPARIAKTLSFRNTEGCLLIVAAGDAKTDNTKFKQTFGFKPRMLTPEEALDCTGHAVGGVCPFALKPGVQVYLDKSLQRFETVFPACGNSNSAIELTCDELAHITQSANWVDVCKNWE